MPEKEAPQHESWEGQNFKNLELEIDKEIDSLFVPAQRADEDATAGPGPGQESQPPEGEASAGSESGLNFDAVQIEIDKEIDKLFVPAPHSAAPAESSRSPRSARPAESSRSRHSATPAVSSRSPEAVDPTVGISGLIEQFNAAYLSLDWDFSRENLKKFLDSLERLEPMASRSPDAKSLFRIMDVILKRLLQRPHAVNTQLVQLIRDSQGLLAHLLLIHGESGPQEKRRLKELVEKFQALRRMAIAVKAADAGVPPESTHPAPRRSPAQSPRAETEDAAHATASALQPREKTDTEQRRVRRADACLLVSEGKWLALPASSVVKVAPSTRSMGRKVLKRGYATLSDFKPLFRGTKSGVLGQWANLHAKELKPYRFEPMGFDPAGSSSATGKKAVLTSDGQTHRIIFCDAVNFIDDAEIADESSARDLKTTSRVLVPFFDLSVPKSSLPGSPSTEEED